MEPRTDDQPVAELSSQPNGSTRPDAQPSRSTRRAHGPGIVAGALGFLLIMVAGAAIVLSQSNQYSATTTLVVLPDQSIGLDAASNYYDTLSHGQIAATASHILALKQFKSAADSQLHLSPANDSATKIQVTVEAGTSLLTVDATAPTGATAEHLADTVVDKATPTVNSLIVPYRLSIVSRATNTAQSSNSLSLGKFLAILIIVGVASAIGIQQAYNQLASLRRRPVSGEPRGRRSGPPRKVSSSADGSTGTRGSPGSPRRSKSPLPPAVGAEPGNSHANGRQADASPPLEARRDTAANGGRARGRAGASSMGIESPKSTET